MTISGSLILVNVGFAIAKYMVKTWVGSDFLGEISDDLIDIVKDKGLQVSESHQQQNDFDKLAAAMTKQIRRIYDISRLPDNSKHAVIIEAARTLVKADLSIQTILAFNMDAERLRQHLLKSHSAAAGQFSIDETALYQQLISEACIASVETCGLLQSFNGAFAAKLLQDSERLTSMLEKFFYMPDEEAKRFVQQYKETVKDKLDRLEVFGLPHLNRYSRQQSLSVAYISLDTVPNIADNFLEFFNASSESTTQIPSRSLHDILDVLEFKKTEFKRIRSEFEEQISLLGARTWITERSNSMDSLLATKRRVVIQGNAGSGKTTLLQWLAVRSASADFESPLSSWNQTIPFFIRLREYVGKDFPTPQEFPKQVAPMIVERMPTNWVHEVLDSGHGLVLIDGVDELPSGQRNSILERLADLVATYPTSRYVISSRPVALKEQLWPEWKEWVKTEEFTTTSLRDMNSRLVGIFIEQWHQALAASTTDGEEKRKISAHVSSLKSLLNGRPPLRRLAKNPLLCAMICALYQERLQNLPSERLKLYEECVEMLLTRRDEGRQIATNYDYPNLSLDQRLALIQELAYWMISNDYVDVETDVVDQRFERKLPALGITGYKGKDVRQLFIDRTSLLREPIVGRIDFTHLTFQEYLAAREVIEESNFGVLVDHTQNDKWREVIVLALGIARKKEREKALNDIVTKSRQKDKPQAQNIQNALLALACLETSISLEPKLRDEILENASLAIPPTDEDEAKMIASAGDPAIQLLVPRETYSITQTVYCIKTLAMIGSENAMLQLAGFANDRRNNVRQALIAAWDNFDRDQYAQKVLGPLKRLTINHRTQLKGVKHLKNLNVLILGSIDSTASELKELKELPNLSKITILSMEDQDFSFFKSLESLREFTIRFASEAGKLPSFDDFADMQQLTHLSINSDGISHSLEPLKSLRNLVELSIGTFRANPPDIEALQSITNLQRLTLSAVKTHIDLKSIALLTRLTYLNIRSFIVPESLSALSSLKNLEKLSIRILTDIQDIKPLNMLLNLAHLAFSLDNSVNFSELKPMTALRRLDLISNKLIDIRSLSSLQQLTHLDLSMCVIDDIKAVAKLNRLIYLKLPFNHGLDLSIFEGRKNLNIVTMSQTELLVRKIRNYSIISRLGSLSN